MSNTAIAYMVGTCAGVFGLAAYAAWVLVPAWSSYSRGWERVAAAFLTLYVLVTMVAAGAGIGLAIVYFWDRIA